MYISLLPANFSHPPQDPSNRLISGFYILFGWAVLDRLLGVQVSGDTAAEGENRGYEELAVPTKVGFRGGEGTSFTSTGVGKGGTETTLACTECRGARM